MRPINRDYTDIDKSELLIRVAEHGGNSNRAARSTGVPARTLRRWWNALTEDERADFLVEARARQEAWWQEVHDACLQVARSKIEDMTAKEAIIGAGISYDKLALIRGQATANLGTISSDAETLVREMENILSKVIPDGGGDG